MKYVHIMILSLSVLASGFFAPGQAFAEEDPRGFESAAAISENLDIDRMMIEAKKTDFDSKKANAVIIKEDLPAKEEVQTDAKIIEGLMKADIQAVKMDLDFANVPMKDVFMTIGKASDINIMLDPDVKMLMADIHLNQVSLKEGMLLLAKAHGLTFNRVEDSLYVTTKEKIKHLSTESRVIKLRNIKAAQAKLMVADFIKTVNVSEDINSLIVIGQPDEILKVENVIKAIDRPQPQVILEARIIEVNKDALKEMGVDWSDQLSMSYQETGRALKIPGAATSGDNILKIGSVVRTPLAFTTIIKCLENQNKAKVLSNPRVTTMNDREAEIFVGDRIPYTVTTVSGGVATTDVRFEEPGIRLKITPSFIDGEFVVIKVEPEVSFIYSFTGPDSQYPWIKKRQATAYVRVRNNEPFVLGGLLNEEDKKNLYKVPLLGNIPLLGNLFSYEKHTVTDTELIITITPTVVQDNAVN
jgi:type II secretory pathway component GspD/PulD (secretin)